MIIPDAGIYDAIPMADYVADPCPEPSINTSVLRDMLNDSPAHCYLHHARLGSVGGVSSAAANLGSAAHSLVFGGYDNIQWVDAEDWRSRGAREVRDCAVASGRIPMLARDRDRCEAIADRVRGALARIAGAAWQYEQTLIWRDADTGVWCRARPDAICTSQPIIVDLKTTARAEPREWIRSCLYQHGYDLQAAHGEAGAAELGLGQMQYFFLVAEVEPPYCVSLIALDNEARAMAAAARTVAVRQYAGCLKSGQWPGYPFATRWAEPSYNMRRRHEHITSK